MGAKNSKSVNKGYNDNECELGQNIGKDIFLTIDLLNNDLKSKEYKLSLLNKRMQLLNDKQQLELRINILVFIYKIFSYPNLDDNILLILNNIILFLNNLKQFLHTPEFQNMISDTKSMLANEINLLILTYSNSNNKLNPLFINNDFKIQILNSLLDNINGDYNPIAIQLKENIIPIYLNQIETLKSMIKLRPISDIKIDVLNLLSLYSDSRLINYQIKIIKNDIEKLNK